MEIVESCKSANCIPSAIKAFDRCPVQSAKHEIILSDRKPLSHTEKEYIMDQMIAFCGLVCSKCPALLAIQNDDDDDDREKTAAFYL
jgi:hypothetical protein